MSNVLPLTRWKDKRLAEREEFSDVEDYEDEEGDAFLLVEEEILVAVER